MDLAQIRKAAADLLRNVGGAVQDPQFQQDVGRNALDVPHGVSRGMSADLLGGPVDMINSVLQPIGLGAENPALGSKQIGGWMEQAGLLRPETGSAAETAGRLSGALLTSPTAVGKVGGAVEAGVKSLNAPDRLAAALERHMTRSGMMQPITAYHGSPYLFPPTKNNPLGEFDASKAMTGEGAQAYGHGAAYLAENPSVGKGYAETLSNRDPTNQMRLNAHANAQRLANLAGDAKYAADDIRYALQSDAAHPQKELLTDTLKYLETGDYKKPLTNSGYLYKADIPDEQVAKMLDWDKPLSQQHPDVQKALLPHMGKEVSAHGLDMSGGGKILSNADGKTKPGSSAPWVLKTGDKMFDLTQKDIDRMLSAGSGEGAYTRLTALMGSQAKASQVLRDAGIPGIKYLDGGSRGAGDGTRNFVVFDKKHAKILERERNGEKFARKQVAEMLRQGGK